MLAFLLILPVYNEATILEKACKLCYEHLSKTCIPGEWKIVIADNGSTDNTFAIAQTLHKNYPEIVVEKIVTKGRGNAIKEVVKKYSSSVYAYSDIDLPLELTKFEVMFDHISSGRADLVIVRRLGARTFIRSVLTSCLRIVYRVVLGFSYSDVQSGVKFFNNKVSIELVPYCLEKGYFWDLELVALAFREGYKIKEISAEWIDKRFPERESKVTLISDSLKAIVAIMQIGKKELIYKVSLLLYVGIYSYLFSKVSIFYGIANDFHVSFIKGVLILMSLGFLGYHVFRHIAKPFSRDHVSVVMLGLMLMCVMSLIPIHSTDVYWNISYAYNFLHGFNPYLLTIADAGVTPYSIYVPDWQGIPMTHGPLSVLIYTSPLMFVSTIEYVVLVLRLIWLLPIFATMYFIHKISLEVKPYESPAGVNRLTAFLFSAPILILGITDLHNDVFVMLSITAAYFFLIKKKHSYAVLSLVCGFLVKYVTLLLLPLVLWDWLRTSSKNLKATILDMLFCGVTAFSVVLVTYSPFLADIGKLKNFASGLLFQLNFNLPFSYFSQGVLVVLKDLFAIQGSLSLAILPILVLLSLTLWIKDKRYDAFILPLLLLISSSSWITPWYYLWILPLLMLGYEKKNLAVFFTLMLPFNLGLFANAYLISFILYQYAFAMRPKEYKSAKDTFDDFSDNYRTVHTKNISVTGAVSEYFVEYKASYISEIIKKLPAGKKALSILDFGCGDGLLALDLARRFPESSVVGVDISDQSLQKIDSSKVTNASFSTVQNNLNSITDATYDLAIVANVFHHIPIEEQTFWLNEIYKKLRKGGLVVIFEHNPLNPVTRYLVKTCPFDVGVKLVSSYRMRNMLVTTGFEKVLTNYILFMPRHKVFEKFLKIEKFLYALPLGAQYVVQAYKPD